MKLRFLHQSTEERRDMILHGSMLRTLMMLSVPTLMMSVVQAMMPVSDGLFINNVGGVLVASAVTYCSSIVNMMIALSQGLSVAAMAVIGQANGRGNSAVIKHTAVQAVCFTFLMGVAAAPVLVGIAFPIAAQVDPEIAHNVRLYLCLYAMVLPFAFLENIYNAVKNAMGKPEATFIRMIIMLMLKIVFNTIFIVWLRLGIVGCALASLFANVIVCIWMFYELFLQESEDRLPIKGFRFDQELLRELVRIGIPSMLASLMLNFGFFLINNEVQKYGAVVLTGQGIANSITQVCFNLPAAFGAAVTTTVSMNIGAGQADRAKSSCRIGCVASVVTAVGIIALVVPLSPYLTVLFTHQQDVLEIANRALHIYTYSVVGFGICMVVQGAMIGLGRTRVPLVVGFLRIWLFRYLFILATESFLQYYAVFWGNLFSNYLAALVSVVIILRVRWVSALDGN